MTSVVDVPLAGGRYDLRIGSGLLAELGALVREVAPGARAMLVIDEAVAAPWGDHALRALERGGYEVRTAQITAREDRKVMATVSSLHDAMLAARLERRSPLIAMGGGITGDVAGFAAATFLRGIPLIQVPTTLLAMVDASIGGKTGVNVVLPGGGLGKNLVGAFWQPKRVIADPDVLETLAARERRCGLAEGIKHAVIADAALFAWIEQHAEALAQRDAPLVETFIVRCAAIKARIVAQDERESSLRAVLNFGHTFAHAIEACAHGRLHHGEAVAVGMVAAARCGESLGRTGPGTAARIEALLDRVGLPVALPPGMSVAALQEAMAFDKKAEAGVIRLILADDIGRARIDDSVPVEAIDAAWRSAGAE